MLTTDLRFEHGELRLDVGDPNLSAGVGSHRLSIQVRFAANWLAKRDDAKTEAVLLTGDVRVGGLQLGPITPTAIALYRFPSSESLHIALTDEQVVGLEHHRVGDVVLHVTVHAALLDPPTGAHPTSQVDFDYRIAELAWIRLLDQVGAHVAVYLRVPAPLPVPVIGEGDTPPSLSRACATLREARERLHDQQWENSAATARHVLDQLTGLAAIPGEYLTGKTSPKERDWDGRWAMLYHAVRGITNAAHHRDGAVAEVRWSRADADAVLAATAALLARYTDPAVITSQRPLPAVDATDDQDGEAVPLEAPTP